jgi:capsule polysaccharide export protein KpsE/RkpR
VKWPWGSAFTTEQRKETAKMLVGVCQVIILAIIASPFIPELAKKPNLYDTLYGLLVFLFLYLVAMGLLKENK